MTTHKTKLMMKNLMLTRQLFLVLLLLFLGISNTIAQTVYYDNSTQLYGITDSTGKDIVKPSFEMMTCFKNGLSTFRKNGMYGLINEKGTIIFQTNSEEMLYSDYGFNEGLISIKLNGKCGYYSENGKLVIPHIFDYAGQFCDGKAWVKVKEKYCFINKQGQYISDKWFDKVGILDGVTYGINYSDRSNKQNKHNKKQLNYYRINIDGSISVAENPDYLDTKRDSFKNYFKKPSEVSSDLKPHYYIDNEGNTNWKYRNNKGEDVSKEEYSSASNFENGFAVISKKGKEGYLIINEKFETIKELDKRFKPLWQIDESLNFENGLIQVSQLIKKEGVFETWEFYLINVKGDIIKKMSSGVIPQNPSGF